MISSACREDSALTKQLQLFGTTIDTKPILTLLHSDNKATLSQHIALDEIDIFFNERVEQVKQDKDTWIVKTNKKNEFSAPNIIIAGGVGSFEPRKLSLKEIEKFEEKSLFYAVKNKEELKNKIFQYLVEETQHQTGLQNYRSFQKSL